MAIRFSTFIRKQIYYFIIFAIFITLTLFLSAYQTTSKTVNSAFIPIDSYPELIANEAYLSTIRTPPTTDYYVQYFPDLTGMDLTPIYRSYYGMCGEHYDTALKAGWTPEDWPKLRKIMYRESRCLPNACSQSDSGRVCRDWGLMQINEYSWRRHIVSQNYKMSDMHNPYHNLVFARWIYDLEVSNGGTGWGAWSYQK